MASRLSALLLTAWIAAVAYGCSSSHDDTPPGGGGTCPKDDPTTPENEAECKDIATVAAGSVAVGVQKRKCVTCHGANLAGSTTMLPGYPNTPLGETVELYPPNLTNDPDTGLGTWTDDALALAIRKGVDNTSESLCPQMQHFPDMSDFEVYSIVKYLRSIPAVKQKVLRSVCPPLKTKAQQNLP
jgi:hypothetical protein